MCKMADRGQITGGLLDGPLGFDEAINSEGARIKQIRSEVAGLADILVLPDLDSRNMLAKSIEQIGPADMAGVVLGARVPMILAAVARLLAHENIESFENEPIPLDICNE